MMTLEDWRAAYEVKCDAADVARGFRNLRNARWMLHASMSSRRSPHRRAVYALAVARYELARAMAGGKS